MTNGEDRSRKKPGARLMSSASGKNNEIASKHCSVRWRKPGSLISFAALDRNQGRTTPEDNAAPQPCAEHNIPPERANAISREVRVLWREKAERESQEARKKAEVEAAAAKPKQKTEGTETSTTPKAVWVVRAGKRGEEEQIALDNNLVTIHWNELSDLSRVTNKDELEKQYQQANPDENRAAAIGAGVGQVWAFLSKMKPGDLVIIPLRTRPSALAIGEVTGPYAYRSDLGPEVRHTLPVKWLSTNLPRASLRDDLLRTSWLAEDSLRDQWPQRGRAVSSRPAWRG